MIKEKFQKTLTINKRFVFEKLSIVSTLRKNLCLKQVLCYDLRKNAILFS